jgi:hypothetical protein
MMCDLLPVHQLHRVSDTRVTVYYEDCAPIPVSGNHQDPGQDLMFCPLHGEPLQVQAGDQMTVLLTEGGQVAGAVSASGTEARGNAVGIVSDSGAVQMLCGTATIQIPAAMRAD